MNAIQLVGNLTADPRLFGNKGQTPRAVFTIAINERPRDGEEEGVSHFVNATAWGTLAENIVASLTKGTRVAAVGRLNSYKKEVEIDGDEVDLTMLSVTVTALGPDLRWATAEVEKVESKGGNGRSKSRKDEDEEAPKAKSRSRTAKAKAKKVEEHVEDEDF